MHETKHQRNQSGERSNQGKSSRLRWLFPFLCIGFNTLVTGTLLLMRGTGVFQIQQSLLPLLTIGGLLACSSSGTLILIRSLRLLNLTRGQQSLLCLALVLPVLIGMFALLPVEGLTLGGGLTLCLVYFLSFAGVLELIYREGSEISAEKMPVFHIRDEFAKRPAAADRLPVSGQNQADPGEEPAVDEPELIDENHEALFEALFGQGDSALEMEEADESRKGCSQWMNRVVRPEGFEVVEGGTLVQFARNQKVSIVHIGLFPPLSGSLSVSYDLELGQPVRARLLETRGYGVSVEVKRTQEIDSQFETTLHYQITSQPLTEEAA